MDWKLEAEPIRLPPIHQLRTLVSFGGSLSDWVRAWGQRLFDIRIPPVSVVPGPRPASRMKRQMYRCENLAGRRAPPPGRRPVSVAGYSTNPREPVVAAGWKAFAGCDLRSARCQPRRANWTAKQVAETGSVVTGARRRASPFAKPGCAFSSRPSTRAASDRSY